MSWNLSLGPFHAFSSFHTMKNNKFPVTLCCCHISFLHDMMIKTVLWGHSLGSWLCIWTSRSGSSCHHSPSSHQQRNFRGWHTRNRTLCPWMSRHPRHQLSILQIVNTVRKNRALAWLIGKIPKNWLNMKQFKYLLILESKSLFKRYQQSGLIYSTLLSSLIGVCSK